jgi:hypothetical protein
MMGSGSQAKPDPRLAGFVAPKRNIVNPFTSQVARYNDLESETKYFERNNAAKRAFEADPANAGKTYVRDARMRGGEGMNKQEALSAFRKRQRDERAAFDASDLGKANESEADYKARVKAAQQAYIQSRGPTGVTGSPSVGGTDRMANGLRQKAAQRASRTSRGRAMLRITR